MSAELKTGDKILIRKGTRSLDAHFESGEKISFTGDRIGEIVDIYASWNKGSWKLDNIAIVDIQGYHKLLNYKINDLEICELSGVKIIGERTTSEENYPVHEQSK